MAAVVSLPPATARACSALREVTTFVMAVYVLSWLIGGLLFVVFDLGEAGLGAGVLVVAIVALALTRREEGSLRPMLRQIGRWRIGMEWYLAALGVPFLAVAVAVLVSPLLGGTGVIADPPGVLMLLQLPLYVLVLGGPEELGWRGYVLPRLQTRFNALSATLLLGGIWMGWHLPLFLISNALFETIPFVAYFVMGIASSVMYTWLYNSTRGSILLPMLMHGATNLAFVWMSASAITWYVLAATWTVVAIIIVNRYGLTHLARRPRHSHGPLTPLGSGSVHP